jgi:hypothetical protein
LSRLGLLSVIKAKAVLRTDFGDDVFVRRNKLVVTLRQPDFAAARFSQVA